MKWIIVSMFLVSLTVTQAQEKTKEELENEKRFQESAQKANTDTTQPMGWSHTVIASLNLSQLSFTDWAQGGTNSLSYVTRLRGTSTERSERTLWLNSYKFAFGQTRLGGEGLRKTDDEMYAEALLIYKLGVLVNPYVSATIRSQFAKGYTYDDAGNGTASSKFFDPAYLTQSLGMAYKPNDELTTRLGVAVREVLTSEFTLYADDTGTPEIEKSKVEGGLESVTELNWEFAKNMLLTSKLELFAPFKTLDRIVVRNDNIIAARVNEYIVTSLSVQLINDVTVSPRTQVKEMISLGITYALL